MTWSGALRWSRARTDVGPRWAGEAAAPGPVGFGIVAVQLLTCIDIEYGTGDEKALRRADA